MNEEQTKTNTARMGTNEYMAPGVFDGFDYDKKVDVY